MELRYWPVEIVKRRVIINAGFYFLEKFDAAVRLLAVSGHQIGKRRFVDDFEVRSNFVIEGRMTAGRVFRTNPGADKEDDFA